MALSTNDTYRVQCSSYLTEDMFSSLLTLYQPLVGGDGVLIYLTLLAESFHQITVSKHDRLCHLMNHITIDNFERARKHLEEYQLLKTYIKNDISFDNYIYVLKAPLSTHNFMTMNELMGHYYEEMNEDHANETITFLGNKILSTNGYRDVTAPITHLKQYDVDYTFKINEFKPKYKFDSTESSEIDFDYNKFFAITNTLDFPVELRTEENLALIGRLATVYGLTPETMKLEVNHAINPKTKEFRRDSLIIKCKKHKPEIATSEDPYKQSPVSFLQSKQNGANVTSVDKDLLRSLNEDMHFSNEVINVLIEYVLNNYDNSFSKNLVERIAGQWARNKVKTKEDAIAQTKLKSNKTNKKSFEKVPDFYRPDYKEPDIKPLSEEEKLELLALQKELSDTNE